MKTQTTKITVIVPCYNHGAFLREAVESVRSVGRRDLEMIVVDDGSTDARTQQEMERLVSEGVNVIRQANKGLAGARNAAITVARGEYILPLDADDRLRGGWIARGIEILDANGKVGVVYGDAQCFGARNFRWQVGEFDRDLLLGWNCIHATALYRRRIWEENGGYDGTMPVQGLEDWDMWLGAFERGWQFAYIPQVFFEYRQTEGSMITRARDFQDVTEEFIGRKHGLMYRRLWLQLVNERQSVKKTARRLGHLLKNRIKQRVGNGRVKQVET